MAASAFSLLAPVERMRAALATVKERASIHMDSWVNHLTGFGTGRDKSTHGFVLPSRVLSDEELSALYHGDDMAARMVDVVPQEMLREGFFLETGDPKLDGTLADKMEAIDTRGKLVEGLRWGRAFGGAGLLLGCDDGRDATMPLIPEKAKDLSYLYAIDRRMLWPMTYYDQPGDPKLGQVETYMVTVMGGTAFQTTVVHESRLILFRGANTGIRERIQLSGWDLSVMQRAYDILRQFNSGWKSVETLMVDGNQAIFKMTGLADSIGSGGEELLRARLQVMDLYRSVMRALVIDADGKESFERNSANFSGIPDTLDKFMLRLAAAVQIPVTILMGQSPAGMSATGDSDFRWFYDRIRAEQTTVLAPKIRRIADIWMRTKAGQQLVKKLPDQLTVKFPALWTETPLVQAQRRLAIAQADDFYIKNQTLLPDEVALARFRHADGFSDEITLSDESLKARETALAGDLDKILDDADSDDTTTTADEDVAATADLLKLTPSDLAAIVKVNEARASVGLGPLPGKDGDLTLPQFKAKYATVIAAAANADDGTTDDGSGQPHKSTIGVQDPPKKDPPPQFGQPGAPPGVPGQPAPAVGAHPASPSDGNPKEPAVNTPSLNGPPKPGQEARMDAGPRPFELQRDEDETGISGTGKVAEGCEFNDGTVAMRWVGKHQSTTVFASMEHMLAVHGHGGKTRALYTTHVAAGEPMPVAPQMGTFASSDTETHPGGTLPAIAGTPPDGNDPHTDALPKAPSTPENAAALSRLAALPKIGGNPRMAAPPMPIHGEGGVREAQKATGAAKLTQVSISDLHASQTEIQKSKVAGMISKRPTGAAVAVNVGGKIVVIDGHHRVAAAILKGDTQIHVYLHGAPPPPPLGKAQNEAKDARAAASAQPTVGKQSAPSPAEKVSAVATSASTDTAEKDATGGGGGELNRDDHGKFAPK